MNKKEIHYDDLLQNLMEQTFHHSDETAKPIVDEFVRKHKEILELYSMEQLYKF